MAAGAGGIGKVGVENNADVWPVSGPLSQLVMKRSLEVPLPGLDPLPVGFDLKILDRTECDGLTQILQDAFPEVGWTFQKTEERLTRAPDVRAIYVIVHEGLPIATASVRYLPLLFPDAGIVHWVGVKSSERGKQLGRHLTRRVCEHIAADGYRMVVLETDDFRIPAIKTYLAMGFAPEIRDASHAERWQSIMKRIEQSREELG